MLHNVFKPASEGNSRRLMVVLHGLGDSMAGFDWLPSALRLPWMNYLLVDAPDRYYEGYSWYDFAGDHRPGIERSRRELFALLDAQRATGFPTGETTLFGFSQGCLMTVDVGLRYPHLFAGLVGVSGYIFEPEKLELSPVARQQRLLMTHGTQDPLIPYQQVREQVKLLRAAGIQVEWKEFVKAHTIAGMEEISVIRDFVETPFKAKPT